MPTISTLSSRISVTHEELNVPNQSPAEVLSRDTTEATRWLKCAWGSRHTLANQLIGGYDSRAKTWTSPQRYPNSRILELYAKSVSITPFGKPVATSSSVQAYGHAILEVKYAPTDLVEFEEKPELAIFDIRLRPNSEFITLPSRQLYWDKDGAKEPLEHPPGVLVQSLDIEIVRHRQRTIPPRVLTAIGVINEKAIKLPDIPFACGPETLLYAGASADKSETTKSKKEWRLTLTFKYRKHGWNLFFRDNNKPQKIYESGGARAKPYPVEDFIELFKV